MTITLELTEERERELREMAAQQGQDAETLLLSLLDEAIPFRDMEPISKSDPKEYAAAVAGVKRGLADFAAGRHKPMGQFFANMKARHGMPD